MEYYTEHNDEIFLSFEPIFHISFCGICFGYGCIFLYNGYVTCRYAEKWRLLIQDAPAIGIAIGLIRPSDRRLCAHSWWRHQMETFSALLAFCAGNSPVPSGFPTQRPVTRSFDVFFDLRVNKSLSKQSWGWWSETPSSPLWRHCNVTSIERVSNNLVWFSGHDCIRNNNLNDDIYHFAASTQFGACKRAPNCDYLRNCLISVTIWCSTDFTKHALCPSFWMLWIYQCQITVSAILDVVDMPMPNNRDE